MKSSPIKKPRPSPVLTSQQLKPVARTRRRREDWLPLPFPASQVLQNRNNWPIRLTRKDPAVVNEGQYSVAMLFRRVDRNSREVIVYDNDKMISGTSSEEMPQKFLWYEDKLIS
ncbi:hypothetical protein O181_067548 [Austropuccinia psidii MF-1]|uniref:Uncharacterized protein n=1 Tax=Austropuccinia psidii MF-1 TaxID=1389203 RepID=A0A9Q3EYZ4_9BASI|nr:hypothetical protein [Austropuccinia psidii MF-1]